MSIHNIACEAGLIRRRVLVKIIAAIFDFYNRGKVGREREKFLKKVSGEGREVNVKVFPAPSHTVDSISK